VGFFQPWNALIIVHSIVPGSAIWLPKVGVKLAEIRISTE
jgi:hypothetical protein